jgi:hypothetical protein
MDAEARQPAPILTYAEDLARRGVACRTTADGVHVIIPNAGDRSRLVHAPKWTWPAFVALEVLVNVPLLVVSLLVHELVWIRLFRFRPAVEVEVTAGEVIVRDRRDPNIISRTYRWPRAEVGEFRPNRFDLALWVRVPGREMPDDSVLSGLERPLLEYICQHVTPLLPHAHGNGPAPASARARPREK